MLVRSHDGGIDHDVFEFWILSQRLENPLPNALARPSIEPLEDTVPMPDFRREIAPRRARPQHPKYGINKQTIVLAVPASVPWFARDQIFDAFPLCSCQFAPNQDRLLKLRS
jgi:hypothetical protein